MRVLHEAVAAGACCLNYVSAEQLLKEHDKVVGITLIDQYTADTLDIHADVVVNATGVWVDELRNQLVNEHKIRPSRGSHIVLPAEDRKSTRVNSSHVSIS